MSIVTFRCKKCNCFIGAYSPMKQKLCCSQCNELVFFKPVYMRQILYAIVLFPSVFALKHYDFTSLIAYYRVGIPMCLILYVLLTFTNKPCEYIKLPNEHSNKVFKFSAFVVSNVLNAGLWSLFFTTALYFSGEV